MSDALGTIGSMVGTGIVTVLITQYFARREKRDEIDAKQKERLDSMTAEERRDAIGILREALAEKRKDHSECLDRVARVEKALHEERLACDEKIEQLGKTVEHLTGIVITRFPELRDSVTPPR